MQTQINRAHLWLSLASIQRKAGSTYAKSAVTLVERTYVLGESQPYWAKQLATFSLSLMFLGIKLLG